jgi:hypothetical protein
VTFIILKTLERNFTLSDEKVTENPLQICIIWFIIKTQGSAIVEVGCEFRGIGFA